jgi:hypothetical protein
MPFTRGGARPGAGRPKGGENESTKLKRKAEKKLLGRRLAVASRILNAQINLAEGCTYVYEIVTEGEKKVHRLVTDPGRIESFLNDGPPDEDTYMYITTEKPDTRAIADFFDRTFGKPAQAVELSGPDGADIPVATSVDTSKLSTEELRRFRELVARAAVPVVEAIESSDGDGDNEAVM